MVKGRSTIALSLGGLILAAGLMGIGNLCPAIGSPRSAPADGLGFASMFPQKRIRRAPIPNPASSQIEIPEKLRIKQERDLRKYRFDELKKHASELAKLANSLHEDLDKSNENILSLQIVDKAAKIEKLAKKIQDEAKTGT